VELRDYWNTIRRRWVSVAVCFLLALAVAGAITWQMTPQYESRAQLFISTSESDTSTAYQGGLYATQRVASYAELVNESRQLAERVSSSLGGELDPDELQGQVTATVKPETVILELAVVDPDGEQARDIAQAYAEGLSELVSDLETPPGRDVAPIKATIVDNAQISSEPVSPQPLRNLGLAAVLGLLLGVALAVARELLDTSVSSADDVADVTDAPILGNIHSDTSAVGQPPAAVLRSPTPWSEAFRVLRTNMQYVEVDHDRRVFVVSSSLPAEGKSTTAVNLAITLALAKQRVVLIDCDLRRPLVAERLDLDDAVGTTSVLIGQVSLDDALQEHRGSGLTVLTAGPVPPNPSELLQSIAMEKLLHELREQYDVVLLDAPPLLPVTDAALLAAQADGAIVVVRHGRTSREQLRHALDRVEAVDAKIAGVVMNQTPAKKASAGYGYGYGYAPDERRRDKELARAKGGARRR
jgi:capsular exopolysaccharide synthesis family protein